MRRIDLRETGDWQSLELTGRQAELLIGSGLVDVRADSPAHDLWSLRATGNVGAAVLHGPGGIGVDLRVEPKVAVHRLLFLMGYAASAKGWRSDWVDLPQIDDLPAAVGEALARLTDAALRAGLLQGYLSLDEAGMTVRGRVRHVDQFRRHFAQVLPIEVTYDEFTIDIAENRILKAALRRMLRVPSLPVTTRKRLLQAVHRLAEVSDLIAGKPLPDWKATRLNARYGPALRMAELVLAGSSFDLARGTVRASGFMVSMPIVFEDFVTVALGDALRARARGRSVCQDRQWQLDDDGEVKLRPDLVWYPGARGTAPEIVVDAKYKAEKPSGFPNADVYQLLAYCTSLGLATGHLVYAAGNEAGADYLISGAGPGGAGISVQAHTLNLDAESDELLTEIDELAQRMISTGSSSGTAMRSDESALSSFQRSII